MSKWWKWKVLMCVAVMMFVSWMTGWMTASGRFSMDTSQESVEQPLDAGKVVEPVVPAKTRYHVECYSGDWNIYNGVTDDVTYSSYGSGRVNIDGDKVVIQGAACVITEVES